MSDSRPYLTAPNISNTYFRESNRSPLPRNMGNNQYMFPSDLVVGERDFYIQIQFVSYQKRSVFSPPFLQPLGGVTLPIPKKINDQQTVVWQAVEGGAIASAIEAGRAASDFGRAAGGRPSFLGVAGAGVAAGAATAAINASGGIGQLIGGYAGLAPNPFLTMLFKSGDFKDHTFNWTFTPHNAGESETLANIFNYFKFNMLPSRAFGGLLLGYPNIALIRLFPNDFFTYRFKPCAVISTAVDYSGAGQPSFFENGAPTVMNFSLQLKEIELWMQEDFGAFV